MLGAMDEMQCPYCLSAAPAAASKCAACGEWLERRRLLTGAAKIALIAVAAEVVTLLWARLYWTGEMAEAFREFASDLPAVTRFALASPTVPAEAALLAVAAALAIFGVRSTRRRENALIATFGAGLALIGFTVWAIYAPLFELPGNIKA
jgi:hypothetical protein